MKPFHLVISVVIFALFSGAVHADPKVRIRVKFKEAGMPKPKIPPTVDIAGQDVKRGTVDIIGSTDYFLLLKQEGYPVEIVERQGATSKLDERYLKPDEILTVIKQVADTYPNLVHVEEIGKTIKGRPILAIRLSTPENIKYKPAVLFNAMHHAREVMTSEVAIDILLYLTKNFENPDTPLVTEWLSNLAIWIVPQVNPDGNFIVWSSDNWWRKNAHGDDSGIWGVDINRNYPYMWAKCNGSSGNPGSQTYRGEGPGSEPETQAMMNLVKRENMVMSISYHTYSELVIPPYGCTNRYTPERAIVDQVGSSLASLLKSDEGKGTYAYGPAWSILYPVDGDDISWMYNEVNTLAYVIEVNSSSQGFQPNYDEWRNKTVAGQRPGWQMFLNRVLAGPQMRGRVLDAKTGEPVDAEIRIEGAPYLDEKPRMAKNGYYYKILIPGSFEISFKAPGYQSQTVAISIGSEGAVANDVFMERAP